MPETANERRLAIWNRLTPERRDYDRFVARQVPHGLTCAERFRAETLGGRAAKEAMFDPDNAERGCSCHMSAPCSYCESLIECEECGEFVPEDDMGVHLDAEHPLPADLLRRAARAVAVDPAVTDPELAAWFSRCAEKVEADPAAANWPYIQRDIARARSYFENRAATFNQPEGD